MAEESEFLTPEEAAKLLRVDAETVRRHLRAKLYGAKVGGRWRISRTEINSMLQGGGGQGAQQHQGTEGGGR